MLRETADDRRQSPDDIVRLRSTERPILPVIRWSAACTSRSRVWRLGALQHSTQTLRLTAAPRPDSAQGVKTLSRYFHDDNADFPGASPRVKPHGYPLLTPAAQT